MTTLPLYSRNKRGWSWVRNLVKREDGRLSFYDTVHRKQTHSNRRHTPPPGSTPGCHEHVNTVQKVTPRPSIETTNTETNIPQHQVLEEAFLQSFPPQEERRTKRQTYLNSATENITKILCQHNIRTPFEPYTTIGSLMRSAKDRIYLKDQEIQ